MRKLLLLSLLAMATLGSSAGCRGMNCFRKGDRCDQCDPCSHACSMSTPVMEEGAEVIVPRPAPVRRNLNVLPGPTGGGTNG